MMVEEKFQEPKCQDEEFLKSPDMKSLEALKGFVEAYPACLLRCDLKSQENCLALGSIIKPVKMLLPPPAAGQEGSASSSCLS